LENTRVRLSVLISHRRLDRDLAAGCDHGTSDAHAVRARQLAAPDCRRRLAGSLRNVVADADTGAPRYNAAVRPLRGEVTANREALLGLADLLEQTGPLNACGVARTRSMITDGAGPLYSHGAERSLIEAIWWIADGLVPCPPHDWRSPVIMKLDPKHVAWTCSRCGAIAKTDCLTCRPA
jgi:hypothetical protein